MSSYKQNIETRDQTGFRCRRPRFHIDPSGRQLARTRDINNHGWWSRPCVLKRAVNRGSQTSMGQVARSTAGAGQTSSTVVHTCQGGLGSADESDVLLSVRTPRRYRFLSKLLYSTGQLQTFALSADPAWINGRLTNGGLAAFRHFLRFSALLR